MNITCEQILKAVSDYTGFTKDEIIGERGTNDLAIARHIYCLLARRYTLCSLKKVGSFISNRDHATIRYSVNTIIGLMSQDRKYKKIVEEIEELLCVDELEAA